VQPDISDQVLRTAAARWPGYEKWIVMGEVAIVLVTAEESDGAFSLVELIDGPHDREMAPLHSHPSEVQSYRMVEGLGGVWIEGRETLLRAGEQIVVPVGAVHRAWNAGTTMSIAMMSMAPGGVEEVCRRTGRPFEEAACGGVRLTKRAEDVERVMEECRRMRLVED
jgi:quercetin dioxygenase-like cupin family protein